MGRPPNPGAADGRSPTGADTTDTSRHAPRAVVVLATVLALAGLVTAGLMAARSAPTASGRSPAAAPFGHQAYAQQCSDSQFPRNRNPSNPLDLPNPPGPDPLSGAHLFVDGPAHGAAAGAIAQLLGQDPKSYPDDYSWAQFKQDLSPGGRFYAQLASDPALAEKVQLLEQIGGQEETQNLSLYAGGGGPGAIFGQVQKILCRNMTADPDPNAVPVFSTFFIYPKGRFCPIRQSISANWPIFKRQIDEMAAGIGRHRAILLLEIDAVGTSGCLPRKSLTAWEADLRYEIEKLTALPHTVVYLEGGAADENSPQYVAKVLNEVCVVKAGRRYVNRCALMRGFYVNGTHFDWTSQETAWASRVSILLRNRIRRETDSPYTAHFIVNTAQNGQGPQPTAHPTRQGNEVLCNPPGRGLGRAPTAQTNPTFDGHSFPLADGFLWTGVPGRSHNADCHPGDAPAGVFDPRFALELAANASDQLGPPLPVLGRSVDVSVVSGVIFVRLPGAAADTGQPPLTKGQGFVQLTQARALPTGTQIDSRQGTLQLVAASPRPGNTQTGIFGGGVFKVSQDIRGIQKGRTTLSMLEGAFSGGPSYASCTGKASDSGPTAHAGKLSAQVLQTIHASAHGRFRTRGRYAAATVRGTAWATTDRCDGTLTVVRRGTVRVSDLVRHVTVLVHAGHRYLARARRG
jgi:hypothetical protein